MDKIPWLLWMILIVIEIRINIATKESNSGRLLVQENDVRRILLNVGDNKKWVKVKQRQATEKPSSTTSEDDDEKKTLAQQVADGKYGLIQKELFSNAPKRPGIISYEVNPEVPKDNVNNLGGLQPEEIWLAENHLLVIKGGGFNEKNPSRKSVWPPIDNYIAPKRQVKIPANPKVPPPFPVQLEEGGPIEFIKGDSNDTGRFNHPSPQGFGFFPPPPPPAFFNRTQGNFSQGNGPPPFPFPPFPFPPPPLFPLPGNGSEIDEDDPRFYYPPPYDFVYKKDNSSFVPPGPLVPGIVLPPPPNFFAPLTNKTQSTKHKKPPKTHIINLSAPKRVTTPKTIIQNLTPVTVKPKLNPKARNLTTTTSPPTIATLVNRYPSKHEGVQIPKLAIGEWIPIVGPSVCLADGKKCYNIALNEGSIDDYSTVYNVTEPADHFRNPVNINNITPVNKLYTFPPNVRKYYTTTQPPLQYNVRGTPAVSTPHYYSDQPKNRYNHQETYYFYQEPQITEAKVIDADSYSHITTNQPTVLYKNVPNKYETNTISPFHGDQEEPVRKPKVNKIKPSRLHIYDQEINKFSINNNYPLRYVINDKPVDYEHESYTYSLPLEATISTFLNKKTEPKTVTKSTRSRSKYEQQRVKSNQNPVFEYSFSAPGYGTKEPPKISSSIPTTERGILESKVKQLAYFEYNGNKNGELYTTPRHNKYPQHSYTAVTHAPQGTPPPLYTEADVYDDITNNYFTLFGKKINPDAYTKYITTPLPPQTYKKPYYSDEDPRVIKKQNIRFPEESTQPPHAYYKEDERDYPARHKTNYDPIVLKQRYQDYSPELVPVPASLESDIRVNYRKPLPPYNPDAEFIHPHPPSNSYISYQLPGNGGHFYFLTPQIVHAENYQLGNSGVRYPSGYNNRLYYKRNIPNGPNRKEHPVES